MLYVRQCFNLFIIRPPAGAESLSGHSESERRPLMAAANWPVSSTLHHYDTLTCTQWSPFKVVDVGIRPSVSSPGPGPGLQIEKKLPVRYSNKQVLIENDGPIRRVLPTINLRLMKFLLGIIKTRYHDALFFNFQNIW